MIILVRRMIVIVIVVMALAARLVNVTLFIWTKLGHIVLFHVPFDVVLFELISLGKIVRKLSLLHRMPHVKHPVGRGRLTTVRNTAGTIGNLK